MLTNQLVQSNRAAACVRVETFSLALFLDIGGPLYHVISTIWISLLVCSTSKFPRKLFSVHLMCFVLFFVFCIWCCRDWFSHRSFFFPPFYAFLAKNQGSCHGAFFYCRGRCCVTASDTCVPAAIEKQGGKTRITHRKKKRKKKHSETPQTSRSLISTR